MRWTPMLAALALAGVTGCAAAGPGRGEDPRAQLNEGFAALDAHDWARARALLEPLYYQRWREPVGQQALLTLIALELDGRNPDRRLWAASDLSARLLSIPEIQPWMVPIAESYYLLALELGAAEERIAQAESAQAYAQTQAMLAERATDRALPASNRESVPERINRIVDERNEARAQVDRLTQQIAARDRDLRDTKAELERIRKTIRP